MTDWRPTATPAALRRRAALLAQTRAFFASRGVLEVQTPLLVGAAASDPQIASFSVRDADDRPAGFLHTSPEYAMKRLLAAGSGDIFQLGPVFRAGERGRLHNPEFTLLEWYRSGYTLEALMQETASLIGELLAVPGAPARTMTTVSYRDAFLAEVGLDPFTAATPALGAAATALGLAASSLAGATRDELLDFLVATQVGPRLGQGGLCCLHHYPASQAALAQLDPAAPETALRFELYADGIELANGYVELGDAVEQRRRFDADLKERLRRGLPAHAGDERLLEALRAGLPACAGVAVGFDRVVQLALGAAQLDAALAFPSERA